MSRGTGNGGDRVAIVGAGVMGTGIATLITAYEVPVALVDVDGEILARALEEVAQNLRLGQLLGRFGKDVVAAEIEATTSLGVVADAVAVVEAVPEQPQTKAEVIGEISQLVRRGTPILTNTSAIPIDELAGHASRPAEVLGTHFMNPAHLIKTIEVIRGPRTADAVLERVTEMLRSFGLNCIVVGDGPGFVVNRMLQRMINEAARVVEEGLASPTEVDALFCGCLGHSTGPLATADLIGLDNVVDSLNVLYERTQDRGFYPCDLLLVKIHDGDYGRKTGRGFYGY